MSANHSDLWEIPFIHYFFFLHRKFHSIKIQRYPCTEGYIEANYGGKRG